MLKKYINEVGDVILDPYGGSGGIVEFVLKHKKRAIYNDINPIASLVARYNIAFSRKDAKSLMKCLTLIKSKLNHLNNLYREYCPFCNNISDVKFRIYYNGKAISYLKCNHSVNSGDIKSQIPQWALTPLSYGGKPFLKARKNLTIADLFTRRNLIILNALRKILPKCSEIVKYVLVPIIYLSSKMTHLPEDKEKMLLEGKRWMPSWALPAYWLPKKFIEFNPLELIERRINTILRCKRRKYVVGSIDDVLNNKAHVAFLNGDASALPLPDNSVDIITDPPYPTDVQYGELYYLHSIILDIPYDVFSKELVVNKNRKITFNEYLDLFDKHLTELHRVCRKYAIFIIKNDIYTNNLLDKIGKYFKIQNIEEIVVNKRKSRIGDYKREYRYMVVVTTKRQ
ncbi:MAG: hypothetical protein QW680_09490 [Pyrobaculum sp.]